MVASKNLLPLGKKLFYACGLFIIGMRKCLPADTTQHTTVWNKSGSSWIWEVSYEFWRVPRRFEKKVPSERQMAVQPPVCFSWHKKWKFLQPMRQLLLTLRTSPLHRVLSSLSLSSPSRSSCGRQWTGFAWRAGLALSNPSLRLESTAVSDLFCLDKKKKIYRHMP